MYIQCYKRLLWSFQTSIKHYSTFYNFLKNPSKNKSFLWQPWLKSLQVISKEIISWVGKFEKNNFRQNSCSAHIFSEYKYISIYLTFWLFFLFIFSDFFTIGLDLIFYFFRIFMVVQYIFYVIWKFMKC